MRYRIVKTEEFKDWFSNEPLKSQTQIDKRIANIQTDGHFGTINDVGSGVVELKWKNGRRVYYAYLEEEDVLEEESVLLLLGGNKNGQNYDIKKAQKILNEYTE